MKTFAQMIRKWGGSYYFAFTKFMKFLGITGEDEPVYITPDEKRKILILSREKLSDELKVSLGFKD